MLRECAVLFGTLHERFTSSEHTLWHRLASALEYVEASGISIRELEKLSVGAAAVYVLLTQAYAARHCMDAYDTASVRLLRQLRQKRPALRAVVRIKSEKTWRQFWVSKKASTSIVPWQELLNHICYEDQVVVEWLQRWVARNLDGNGELGAKIATDVYMKCNEMSMKLNISSGKRKL